jgi:U3 small nucleolar ribonucleoprotein component
LEEEGEDEIEEDNADLQDKQDADDELENEIFAQARENKEMKPEYANQEMLEKIEKIEKEMMNEKKWQMKGEI